MLMNDSPCSLYDRFLFSYTQELPTRFKKEIVLAAAQEHSDKIVLEGMQRVLHNIGADNRLSSNDLKAIFQEVGNESGEIPAQSLIRFL
jgi:hypothetical protein